MSFFKEIEQLPADPIFGLKKLFACDSRPDKIDLGIGSYLQPDGQSIPFQSVMRAEEQLTQLHLNKDYLPILGDEIYRDVVFQLIFGLSADSKRMASAQALGGTGALRMGAEFLHQHFSLIYLPESTWLNHAQIFGQTGFKVKSYPYYDHLNHCLDFAAMRQAIAALPMRSLILLQCSCHNPTGTDPSKEQWEELLTLFQQRQLFPFFDLAYQGFGQSLEEDAFPLRLFAAADLEMAAAYTFSKTLGLYGERAGWLGFYLKAPASVAKVESQLSRWVRSTYSNPPLHGERIVCAILQSPALCRSWQSELEEMRQRLIELRRDLVEGLERKSGRDFQFINRQRGMFAFTGLSKAQVSALRNDHALYLPDNGRVNLAGLNDHNIGQAISKLLEV